MGATLTLSLWRSRPSNQLVGVEFVWDVVIGASSYVLQVGTATTQSDRFNQDVGDVLAYGLALSPGTYYSRVVPQGAGSTTDEQAVTV